MPGAGRMGGRGWDRLTAIMILIAYFLIGGIGGFASSPSGHLPQETVHLSSINPHVDVVRDICFDPLHATPTDNGHHALSGFPRDFDETVGASSAQDVHSLAATTNQLTSFVHLILVNLQADFLPAGGLAMDTRVLASANPEWWLRTVVLHL